MKKQKLDNVLSLTADERYEYSIREFVQFEKVWVLGTEEGYVSFKDNEGDEMFPIWPHRELVEECMFEEHRNMGAIPEFIFVESFVQNCIPDMIGEGVLFGVFYDRDRRGLAVDGAKLSEDIKFEFEEIWDESLE